MVPGIYSTSTDDMLTIRCLVLKKFFTHKIRSENTHRRGKDHCTAGLQIYQFGFNCFTRQVHTNNNKISSLIESNLVKPETSRTMILPTTVSRCMTFSEIFYAAKLTQKLQKDIVNELSYTQNRERQIERERAMTKLLPSPLLVRPFQLAVKNHPFTLLLYRRRRRRGLRVQTYVVVTLSSRQTDRQ